MIQILSQFKVLLPNWYFESLKEIKVYPLFDLQVWNKEINVFWMPQNEIQSNLCITTNPRDPEFVSVVDGWSLLRGIFMQLRPKLVLQNGDHCMQVVAIWKWTLAQVWLLNHFSVQNSTSNLWVKIWWGKRAFNALLASTTITVERRRPTTA